MISNGSLKEHVVGSCFFTQSLFAFGLGIFSLFNKIMIGLNYICHFTFGFLYYSLAVSLLWYMSFFPTSYAFFITELLVSVQFSCSLMSDPLWPHGLPHARLPTLSPTPRAWSNSCSLSRWCHLTISSSVIPFSSYPQSFPALGSFLVVQFIA